MPKIIKNGVEYGGGLPPLGDGLTVNQTTGELEVVTASEEDIDNLISEISATLQS